MKQNHIIDPKGIHPKSRYSPANVTWMTGSVEAVSTHLEAKMPDIAP